MNTEQIQEEGARTGKKRSVFRRFLPVIILVILIPILCVGAILFGPMSEIFQADEGFRHAKRNINPELLRAWALKEIEKQSATNSETYQVPRSQIIGYVPDSILHMYSQFPKGVLIVPKKPGQPGLITIAWGGGFFHWWLTIGDTNYFEPYKSDNPEYPYNFEWVPGIYYSREDNWPLL